MKANLVFIVNKKEVEKKKEELKYEYMRLMQEFREMKEDGEEFIDISRKIFRLEGKIEFINELF